MRVATRRLRSALKSFAKILDLPGAGRLRAELKWLGGVLGEARDNEVLAPYLHARLAELPVDLLMGPVQARVGAHFAPRAASARVSLLAALDSGRFIALLNDLDQAFGGPLPAAKARRPVAEVLPAAVKRTRRRVRGRARRAARELAMHETRKAAKDARYAAEAASLAGRKKHRRSVRRMKKLQTTLGDHHDAVVARDTAREIGVRAHLAGENAFSFGLLYEGCQRDALMLEKQVKKQWTRAFGPEYGSWRHWRGPQVAVRHGADGLLESAGPALR
jgi:CHAD domain-containing protein